jgi:transmembrane sensor
VAETIDKSILTEAADWILLFQSGNVNEQQREAFERWRARSPAHAEAWQRAEALLSTFDRIPNKIGSQALQGASGVSRRRALRGLLMLVVAAPAVWYVSSQLRGDWQETAVTARGQRKSMQLPDGTTVVLNTDSAVDVRFTRDTKEITLTRGEILITSGHDDRSDDRPLLVRTPHGSLRALGTRFSVRLMDEATRSAVFDHAIEISPVAATARILNDGQQATFTAQGIVSTSAVDDSDALWERGMLLLKNVRLADAVAELGRYRTEVLRCDPAVADLRVSGSLSLDDTDRALAVLVELLPLRIDSSRPNEIVISPR